MPAFVPGAPNAPGMDTRAAFGGTGSPAILRVINTNDAGAGSFRAAAEATGDRVIIFETSGTCTLQTDIIIRSPYCTIAGQTAPPPGFTIKRYGIQIFTHDVAIQHLHIRKGNTPGDTVCGNCVEAYYYTGVSDPYNLVFDHVSSSWGQDENFVFLNYTRPINAVVWRSMIYEGMYGTPGTDACGGGGGSGGHGMLVYADTTGVTVAQSVFGTNHERNPNMQGGTGTVLLNNIVYNWHGAEGYLWVNFQIGGGPGNPVQASCVGNLFIPTSQSNDGTNPDYCFWFSANGGSPAGNQIYRVDNIFINNLDGLTQYEANQWSYDPSVGSPPPNALTPVGYTPIAASALEAALVPNVGAFCGARDTVDTRFIGELQARYPRPFPTYSSDTGGWDTAAPVSRGLTTPTSPNTVLSSGYTILEEWLHGYANTVEGSVAITDVPNATGTIFQTDTFTGPQDTPLQSHLPEIGGSYSLQTGSVDGWRLSNNNRLRNNIADTGMVAIAGGIPFSSQYDVEIDFINITLPAGHDYAIWARASAVAVTGIFAIYSQASSQFQLWRVIAGSYTLLGSASRALGAADRMRLLVRDTSISVKVNGTPIIYSTDSAITGAGRVGLGAYAAGGVPDSNTTGVHLDRFIATDVLSGGVALAGVQALASTGACARGTAKSIGGFGSTTAVGTLNPGSNKTVTLAGVTATTFQGVFGNIRTPAPVSSAVTIGLLSLSRSKALAGLATAASIGAISVLQAGTVSLSGVTSTTATGAPSVAVARAVSGTVGTSARGTVTAGQGLIVLTGVTATAARGTVVAPTIQGLLTLSSVSAIGIAEYIQPPATLVRPDTIVAVIPNFMTIAGLQKQIYAGWTITDAANNTGTMRFQILSEDGTYVPALDAEIAFFENGIKIFGGNVSQVRTGGAGGEGSTAILSDVTATDFNALATRRYYHEDLVPGTLKDQITLLFAYCPGVKLSATQVTGPTISDEISYQGWKIADVLNQLTERTGYIWDIDHYKIASMYAPGTKVAPFSILTPNSLAVLDVTVEPSRQGFANRVIVYGKGISSVAVDWPSVTANGFWELVASDTDNTDQASLDHLAAAILAASLPVLKTVKYNTLTAGLQAGMTQTINLPGRLVNNTYIITEVQRRYLRNSLSGFAVTAIEGLVLVNGWREIVKSWGGAQMGSTAHVGTSGGGTTVAANVRNIVQLGGNGTEATSSPIAGAWVPVAGGLQVIGQSSIQPSISTIPRGGTDATVTIRGRVLDAGNSVTVRLYDVTVAAACPGVSASINTTTWQTLTFGVTLTAGSHFYELQQLTSVVGGDASIVGYLE